MRDGRGAFSAKLGHLFAVVALGLVFPATVFAQVEAAYLYTLSSFGGPLRYDGVRVRVDDARDETYVIYQNIVRVYNSSGMETFSFGDDLNLGQVVDLAVDEHGDVILLTYKDSRPAVVRCSFRGVPVGEIEVKKLPDGLAFSPNRVLYRNGLFYFVSLAASRVIITDATGEYRKHIDLLSFVDAEAKEKDGAETIGFTVDREGNIFFTVPTMFKVCKLSPDGKMAFFGRSGSAPGRFGVLGGIAVDSRGNLLVADKLKCVVMVFTKDFSFVREFGSRGARPQNLIVPDDLAVDRRDRIYVSQARRRGVSVFALTYP